MYRCPADALEGGGVLRQCRDLVRSVRHSYVQREECVPFFVVLKTPNNAGASMMQRARRRAGNPKCAWHFHILICDVMGSYFDGARFTSYNVMLLLSMKLDNRRVQCATSRVTHADTQVLIDSHTQVLIDGHTQVLIDSHTQVLIDSHTPRPSYLDSSLASLSQTHPNIARQYH